MERRSEGVMVLLSSRLSADLLPINSPFGSSDQTKLQLGASVTTHFHLYWLLKDHSRFSTVDLTTTLATSFPHS